MTIRQLQTDDLKRLEVLAIQLGYQPSLSDLECHFSKLIHSPHVGLLAGILDNQLIAFTQVQEVLTLLSGPRAELNSVVVDQNYHGRGFGRCMIEAAEEWPRSRRLKKMRLGSRISRIEAHEFYKRLGYTLEKSWHLFGKDLS